MNKHALKAAHLLIDIALKEDVGDGDITTDNIVPAEVKRRAVMVAKSDGVSNQNHIRIQRSYYPDF